MKFKNAVKKNIVSPFIDKSSNTNMKGTNFHKKTQNTKVIKTFLVILF